MYQFKLQKIIIIVYFFRIPTSRCNDAIRYNAYIIFDKIYKTKYSTNYIEIISTYVYRFKLKKTFSIIV